MPISLFPVCCPIAVGTWRWLSFLAEVLFETVTKGLLTCLVFPSLLIISQRKEIIIIILLIEGKCDYGERQ